MAPHEAKIHLAKEPGNGFPRFKDPGNQEKRLGRTQKTRIIFLFTVRKTGVSQM
jgi:hypothetical protein